MNFITGTRRTTCIVTAAIAALAGAGVTAAASDGHGATAASVAAGETLTTCTLKSVDLAPSAVRGEDFGTLSCAPGLGKGVQHNTGALSPTSRSAGRAKGTSELYFETGHVQARFTLKYVISGHKIKYMGQATIIGGTGAYAGITGSAKLSGVSRDGGTHATFTERITHSAP